MPVYSLVYPFDDALILLASQISGKWKGYLNGFGGEFERHDPSFHACARRELKEEAGIVAAEGDLTLHGSIMYVHDKHEFRPSRVYVYFYEKWDGKYHTRGELERTLYHFPKSQLPYDRMPPHDILWLPRMLNGEFVEATLTYETTDRDDILLKSVEFVNTYTKPTRY